MVHRISVRSGASWIVLLAALAVPLGYFRNWLLSVIDSDASAIGAYACLLLLFQLLSTFAVFGGPSVLTNFLPQIREPRRKANYVLTYWFVSIPLTVTCILLVFYFGEQIENLRPLFLSDSSFVYILLLAPVYVSSQISLNALTGLMRLKTSAVMTHFQLMVVVLSLIFFTLSVDKHSSVDITQFLFSTLIGVHLVALVINVTTILSSVSFPSSLHFPKTFWRQSTYLHISSICFFRIQQHRPTVCCNQIGVECAWDLLHSDSDRTVSSIRARKTWPGIFGAVFAVFSG